MLDIKFIRENPDTVKKACELKGMTDYTDQILALDARIRELKTITQSKTAEKNKITREIPTATDKGPLIAKSKEINARKMKKSKEIIVLEYAFLLEKRQKYPCFSLEKRQKIYTFALEKRQNHSRRSPAPSQLNPQYILSKGEKI